MRSSAFILNTTGVLPLLSSTQRYVIFFCMAYADKLDCCISVRIAGVLHSYVFLLA